MLEIGQQPDAVLDVVRRGHFLTRRISVRRSMSISTAFRNTRPVRERGYDIRIGRREHGWPFVRRDTLGTSRSPSLVFAGELREQPRARLS